MAKDVFSQLELLVKSWQVKHLKKIYPDFSGIKFGDGFLWQHPGNRRQDILFRFNKKVQEFGL